MIPQGYKRSEFGIIPVDWVEAKWGECLVTFSSGATPYRGVPAYYKGNLKWISSGELNYNVIFDTIEHISEQAVKDTNLKVHQPGTLLIAITGLEAEGTRGRCALVGTPATTNQSCLAINGTDKVCIEYLFEFYKMFGNSLAFKYCQGTKQQSYTADIVKKLPIIYPQSIDEQKAIAKKLSEMDGLIAALGKQIEKKSQIKEGAMQKLLTGKTRLPGFCQPWVEKTIEEIGLLTGAGVDKTILYNEQPIRLVNYLDVFRRDFIYDKELNHWVTANDKKISQCNVCKGDLFFTPSSEMPYDIALSSVAMEDMKNVCYSYHIYRLRFIEDIDLKYKAYMFKSKDFYDQANQTCEGSGKRYVISLSKFRKLKVYYPSDIKEQEAIACVLYDMDDEIRQLEAERDKYTLIKKSMMQELLTGKTRLA